MYMIVETETILFDIQGSIYESDIFDERLQFCFHILSLRAFWFAIRHLPLNKIYTIILTVLNNIRNILL